MTSRYDAIPLELRQLRNWVVWKLEKRTTKSGEVRTTKPPRNARTGKLAKSNDPATWSSFEEAVAALERGFDGIGFCLIPPYVGVDLDGCRESGNDEPWASEIIRELDSYTELSPSRKGVHTLVKGALPDGPRQKDFPDREHHGGGLYDAARGRYFTMTGERICGNGTIAERSAELQRIHARMFPPKQAKPKQAKAKASATGTDDDLIARAKAAKNGGKFSRVFDGHWEDDYSSQSEADLALCTMLAFWTGRDAGRIDALFRRSGLMRDKWDRDDYREATIAKAIDKTTETWTPRAAKPDSDQHVVEVVVGGPLSIELLNRVALFQGRIKFAALRRTGSIIQAEFADGRKTHWRTATDLRTFARSQDLLLDATGFLLPTPSNKTIKRIWEPIAQMIRSIADENATNTEAPLEDEFGQVIRTVWERADRPQTTAEDADKERQAFNKMLQECLLHKRDYTSEPPPCCVWVGEGSCWIHQPSLMEWLSTPVAKHKHYGFDDVRAALQLLGFSQRDLNRSVDGKGVHCRVWEGPLDVLIDDETEEESRGSN